LVIIPSRVRDLASRISLPGYIYDLTGLASHAAAIRAALPASAEFYYAVKANPDPEILRTLVPHVDGFEVSSGGELRHVTKVAPEMPVAFGGPGKTRDELDAAVAAGVTLHVESAREARELAGLAARDIDVLLRVNPPAPMIVDSSDRMQVETAHDHGPDLVMGGAASPFGMDLEELQRCRGVLGSAGRLRVRGLHAHVASGLSVAGAIEAARRLDGLAEGAPLINCGGGMGVDYRAPEQVFGWAEYGRGLAALGRPVRIEPGRTVTAYCGWYVTRVLDVKTSYGQTFAIVAGGTHHLRTPAAKGHDQPCVLLGDVGSGTTTFTGQLCTPKDVLAKNVPGRPRAGDIVAFGMAGAYAWNISHHSFLMHPEPSFNYV
jgi:diaminopimelate decarboxylase